MVIITRFADSKNLFILFSKRLETVFLVKGVVVRFGIGIANSN